MKPVVLVVLWLWPSSLLAYPTITVSPDEEQNLNHYVQVLQNLIMSVPTRDQGSDKKSEVSRTVEIAEPRSSPDLMLIHTPDEVTSEHDVLIRPVSEDKTTFPSSGFTLGMDGQKETESTAFWSIRPNNVSIVLHSDEPYIEKDEPEPEHIVPEPEPEPEPEFESEPESESHSEAEDSLEPDSRQNRMKTESSRMPSLIIHPWLGSTRVTLTTRASTMDVSTDTEDVPQLSGLLENEDIEEIAEHGSQNLRYEEILGKIYDIHSEILRGPLGDSNNPEYKEYIKASREHLKRSLALAAAAEHKLQQMYTSRIFPEDQMIDSADDMETVIDVLYNSRSKLSEYLNIKHIPTELRQKTTAVTGVLKRLLCVDQIEIQHLIRKLLSNNLKILNILDIP
uniref:Sperm equatorial segment protein 1 n=1 Tax=Cricetulus griseus TaxID=10029 RepID=A0A8C2MG48_CRIGR